MKFKSGFTLVEIVIFLILAGILMAVLFSSIKPKEAITAKNVKYKYAAAYDALNVAVFDLVSDDNKNPFDVATPEDGYKKLCQGLAEYINTTETHCDVSSISDDVTYAKDETFDFKTLTPHLTSLNGMNFYISKLIKDNSEPKSSRSYYNSENPDFDLQFFMVYVDLNAKDNSNRVHSIQYVDSEKVAPDVFAFAVIPTGEAIPMGVAEYNIKYLQTRVSYREDSAILYSPYYSYVEAKHAAWNWYKSSGVSEKTLRDKISFTYNDYIRKMIEKYPAHSQLYKFLSTTAFNTTFSTPLFSKCKAPSGTALTPYDMCRITVDTPHFGATH